MTLPPIFHPRSKYRHRLIRVAQVACLILLLYIGLLLLFVLRGPEPASFEERKSADVAVIFGAAVWGDYPSPRLQDRLNAAYATLKDLDCPIIVSGGQGSDEHLSEALAMKRYLVALGLSEQRIFLEDKATSTRENIAFSDKLIADLLSSDALTSDTITAPLKPPIVLVITSDYHMRRVTLLAKQAGWLALPVPAHHTPQDKLELVPRELLALSKDLILSAINRTRN